MTTQSNKGFTIVELLIVIVVIAILAAISIVAYTGIQNRARASSGQQLAAQIAKKFEAAGAIKGTYYSSTAGVTGAQLNTYANAAPAAPEAVVDTPANVLAATSNAGAGFDATAASNGTRVATWACSGGALVFWWDYSVTTGQLKSIRAGAGC